MFRTIRFYFKHIFILLIVIFLGYWAWLDKNVVSRFEQQKWNLPARVYAAPVELFVGAPVSFEQFVANLDLLGYEKVSTLNRSGQYAVTEERVEVATRRFKFPDAVEPARFLSIEFQGAEISRVSVVAGTEATAIARLEPLEIGVIHPGVFEDRVLLSTKDVQTLVSRTTDCGRG